MQKNKHAVRTSIQLLSLLMGASLAQVQAAPQVNCTQVIGFSQTMQWYNAKDNPSQASSNFETLVGDGRFQLLGKPGSNIDFWADPNFEGWSTPVTSPCAVDSNNPQRIILNISGNTELDPAVWAGYINDAVTTAFSKYSNLKRVYLQAVVGGPGNGACYLEGQQIRATENHPVIDEAIGMLTRRDIVVGMSPEVFSCTDYSDVKGHLLPIGQKSVGTSIGSYYGGILR